MTEDTSSRCRDDASIGTGYRRRTFIAVGSGVGAALIAGCTSEDSSSDGTPTDDGGDESGGGEAATFRLLVSDAPADIDDFDRLDVTFSEARMFEGGDEEGEGTATEGTDEEQTGTEDADAEGTATDDVEEDQQQTTDEGSATENGTATEKGTSTENNTATETDPENGTETGAATETDAESGDDEGDRGFYALDLDDPTVDLTQVVGDVAQPIFDGELEAGSYQKLELHVADVEGVVDGAAVEVKVPSEKLQLTKPFEVRAGEELDFVFDINVVKRGNQASYNLEPVISQSGVRGEDVEVEETGGDGERGDGSDDGAGSKGSDDEDGGGGHDDGTDDGTGGNETGGAGDETGGAGDETGGNESAA